MWTAESISQQCEERLAKCRELLERLDFQNWIQLEELLLEPDLSFPRLVSSDESVRKASSQASKKVESFWRSLQKYKTKVSAPPEEAYYWECVSFENDSERTVKSIDLNTHYNKPRSQVFQRDQLDGLEFQGDQLEIKISSCPAVLNFCTVEETRRAAAHLQDCVLENLDLIPQLGLCRSEHPEATEMYRLLLPKLQEKVKKELKILGAEKVNYWDFWFYRRKLARQVPFYPVSDLVDKTMEFLSAKFEIRFVKSDQPVWHSTVQSFQVYEGDSLLGDLYLDLYVRDHKVSNNCTSVLRQNLVHRPGAVAILCHFGDRGSYDTLVEVLHEFGHALHCLFGKTKYARFSGVRVDRRYVELPSQYCELFVWEIFQTLATEQQVADCKFNDQLTMGVQNLHDAALGLIDLELDGPDPQAIADKLWLEITGQPRDSGWLSGWWQLYNGYHGLYWTYTWTKIMAADLFGKIDLRKLIRHGGSVPFEELVDFQIEQAIETFCEPETDLPTLAQPQ